MGVTDSTVEECAELCEQHDACVAFEFGVDYGAEQGGNVESTGDCHMQDSDDSEGCNGCTYNNDLYVVDPNYEPPMFPMPTPLTNDSAAPQSSSFAPQSSSFAPQSSSFAPSGRRKANRVRGLRVR